MARPVTIFTGQWGDMTLEEVCKVASEMGYEGLEIAFGNHLDVKKAATDKAYVAEIKATLDKYGLKCWAVSCHLIGQCTCDVWDPRLDAFAPPSLAGDPAGIKQWAVDTMMLVPEACKNMGVYCSTGFMGSPIWKYLYSFPATTEEMIEDGFDYVAEIWTPILDKFEECGVKFALEVHPTEIAYDYYTAARLLEKLEYHPAFGFNFDPSHLVWQGVDPVQFLRDFSKYIVHVHMKDVAVRLDGKAGILGSHITFGDTRRGWNFRSLGHGDVDFDDIIRELNQMEYHGPLSVEWEDSGMERIFGATEACEFVKQINFEPSTFAFDSAMEINE